MDNNFDSLKQKNLPWVWLQILNGSCEQIIISITSKYSCSVSSNVRLAAVVQIKPFPQSVLLALSWWDIQVDVCESEDAIGLNASVKFIDCSKQRIVYCILHQCILNTACYSSSVVYSIVSSAVLQDRGASILPTSESEPIRTISKPAPFSSGLQSLLSNLSVIQVFLMYWRNSCWSYTAYYLLLHEQCVVGCFKQPFCHRMSTVGENM